MGEGRLSPIYSAGEDLTQAERAQFLDPSFRDLYPLAC
jgi:hypothetical protein